MSENLPPGYVHPPDEIDVMSEDELRAALRSLVSKIGTEFVPAFRLEEATKELERRQIGFTNACDRLDAMRQRAEAAEFRLSRAANVARTIYKDCPGELDVLCINLLDLLDPQPACKHDWRADDHSNGWRTCAKCGTTAREAPSNSRKSTPSTPKPGSVDANAAVVERQESKS